MIALGVCYNLCIDFACLCVGVSGIFGNSEDDNTATWRIQALDIANMISAGVVTDMSAMQDLDDFFAIARDNEWHQVTVYKSLNMPSAFQLTCAQYCDVGDISEQKCNNSLRAELLL